MRELSLIGPLLMCIFGCPWLAMGLSRKLEKTTEGGADSQWNLRQQYKGSFG